MDFGSHSLFIKSNYFTLCRKPFRNQKWVSFQVYRIKLGVSFKSKERERRPEPSILMLVIQVRLPQLMLCYRWGHAGWWRTSQKPSTVSSQQALLSMIQPRETLTTPHIGKRASSWRESSFCGRHQQHPGRANKQCDWRTGLRGRFHESWRISFFLTKSEFIFVRYVLLWNEAPPYGIPHGEESCQSEWEGRRAPELGAVSEDI